MPTKSTVADFGDISEESCHTITMEWIIEGVALVFIGILVTVVASITSSADARMAGSIFGIK